MILHLQPAIHSLSILDMDFQPMIAIMTASQPHHVLLIQKVPSGFTIALMQVLWENMAMQGVKVSIGLASKSPHLTQFPS